MQISTLALTVSMLRMFLDAVYGTLKAVAFCYEQSVAEGPSTVQKAAVIGKVMKLRMKHS